MSNAKQSGSRRARRAFSAEFKVEAVRLMRERRYATRASATATNRKVSPLSSRSSSGLGGSSSPLASTPPVAHVSRDMTSLADRPDDEVVKAARDGSEEAFQIVMDRYRRQVYTLILDLLRRPADAEDLTQETFATVHRRLRRYRPHGKLRAWILKIANNAALKALRKRRHDPLEQSTSAETVPLASDNSSEYTPAPRRRARAFAPEVYRAAEELPVRCREVFKLREFEDKSYEYIAHYLNMRLGTVSSHVTRARAHMRAKLGPKWQAMQSDSTPTPP